MSSARRATRGISTPTPAQAPAPATAPAVESVPVPDDAPVPVLTEPRDGIPPVVDTPEALADAARRLAAGHGPLAIDAERASGYRYGQSAYLVQVRREGAGTHLIDPVPFGAPGLAPLAEAVAGTEWILHAATQDIPCLAELGLHPTSLVDTELGARLAGLPRVGLAAVVEHYLGVTLAKEHSAVDWSTRPLPEPWLRYAALDVEVLGALRDALVADLQEQGKWAWAQQEFEALTRFTGPERKGDAWRRLSGMHRLRSPRRVALARELWTARDEVARQLDTSPGRVVGDLVLVEIAHAAPTTLAQLQAVEPPSRGKGRRGSRAGTKGLVRHADVWLAAVARGLALPDSELPPAQLRSDGPPPARAWADRNPAAADRLEEVRGALTSLAEQHRLPVENLVQPDLLRRVVWQAPQGGEGDVREALARGGARPWQVDLVAPLVAAAAAAHPDA